MGLLLAVGDALTVKYNIWNEMISSANFEVNNPESAYTILQCTEQCPCD